MKYERITLPRYLLTFISFSPYGQHSIILITIIQFGYQFLFLFSFRIYSACVGFVIYYKYRTIVLFGVVRT
jgi:hypothetical protein